MPNSTTIRIPPVAELGEIAYHTWVTHEPSFSAGSWATWQQLDDDARHPWLMVGLGIAEAVRAANQHG